MVIDPLKSVITDRKVSHCATIHFNQQSLSKNVPSLFLCFAVSLLSKSALCDVTKGIPTSRFLPVPRAHWSTFYLCGLLTHSPHKHQTSIFYSLGIPASVRDVCFFSKGQVCVCFCVCVLLCVAVV